MKIQQFALTKLKSPFQSMSRVTYFAKLLSQRSIQRIIVRFPVISIRFIGSSKFNARPLVLFIQLFQTLGRVLFPSLSGYDCKRGLYIWLLKSYVQCPIQIIVYLRVLWIIYQFVCVIYCWVIQVGIACNAMLRIIAEPIDNTLRVELMVAFG